MDTQNIVLKDLLDWLNWFITKDRIAESAIAEKYKSQIIEVITKYKDFLPGIIMKCQDLREIWWSIHNQLEKDLSHIRSL